jgi:hypothetical protein
MGVQAQGRIHVNLTELTPWLIGIGNVASAIMVGRRMRSGWAVLAVAQVTFVVYALLTGQQGFVLQMFMVAIASMNWWKWKGDNEQGHQRRSVRDADDANRRS